MQKIKTARKLLALRNETIRTLNPAALARAGGGLTATTPPLAARKCSTDGWTQSDAKVASAACHQTAGCTSAA